MSKNYNNIFLIGPMGSGKSSVGKCLAKISKKDFYDSDHEIQRRTGVSISWIFEVETETGFRKREENVISELVKLDNVVLSTGGGCIVTPMNRRHLSEHGVVIYLKVSLPIQVERTSHRKDTRPLVDVPNPKEKLMELNKIREPLYEEIADLVYDTDNKTPKNIANQIIKDVKKLKDTLEK